jgi:hypothetical protein
MLMCCMYCAMTGDVQPGFGYRAVRSGSSFDITVRGHGGIATGDMK